MQDFVRPLSIPADVVLDAIIKIVSVKLNVKIEKCGVQFEKNWSEAFVPVKINGEYHIITWNNCD
jgi:hypothetical protein